ncbi:MAG: phosphate ABC transporter substrate-binding protein PstS [Bacteriovorax sp.]|nr:phosphate ABC transporter substrate-binding protein PstS [Bacteriovorax sp.]
MIKNLLMFLTLTLAVNASAAQKINGAGATFPYPIYSKWFAEYQKTHKDVEFNYQSIGSGGGIKQVLAQTVDFGATDAPMSDEELKSAKTPIRHIPTVLGAVVVAYNVKDVPATLHLDGETLANIFLGTVTKWNDASIAKLNTKIKLPATDILVVRRSDGSGTSAIFTEYLANVSADFKTKVGVGKNVNWPAGIGAKGNEGVTAMVSQTDGAIGYTELAYAVNSKLNVASMKNAKGEFIVPSVASITAAAASVKKFDGDLRISIINVDAKGAYPISSFTYILLPEDKASAPLKEVRSFLGWALKEGQTYAAELYYAPLPKKMSEALLKTLK